jgi:hypothetical protein
MTPAPPTPIRSPRMRTRLPTPDPALSAQAALLAALGEPNRLAIVRVLAAGRRSVTDLAKAIGSTPVNTSHHLMMLRRAGILTAEAKGKFWWYTLVGAEVRKGSLVFAHPSGLTVSVPLG